MEYQIDQFVSQQREAVEMGGRDREFRRDRDRRRERSRDRDHRDSHRDNHRDSHRDSHRDRERRHRDRDHREFREDKDERRRESDRHYSRSRDRHTVSPEPTGYEDSSGYLREEDRYPGYTPAHSAEHDASKKEDVFGYGDTDDRYDDYTRRSSGGRDKRAAEKWITETATNTIILRGLPVEIDEKDIRAQLMITNTPVKEVRLVKDKISGASRGFAFVEFQSVGDAQQWMEQNQGQLYLLNKFFVNMYYSTPKRDVGSIERNGAVLDRNAATSTNLLMGVIGDWICSKCGVHNFKRREHCFKCNISRDESDRGKEGDGYDQVGHNPCNTLVLRGLDMLTSEETIRAALAQITLLTMKNIYVHRDVATAVSKGYAFLEMNTIADSSQLVETVNKFTGAFEVDGKAVMVNYAKNTFSTIMTTLSSQYYGGSEYSQFGQEQQGFYGEDGQYYDAAQYYGQYDYSQYYNADGTPVVPAPTTAIGTAGQTNSTNAAAAVAQAAISKAQAAKAIQKKKENMQKELIKKIKDQEKVANMTPEERIKHQAEQWAVYTVEGSDGTEYTQYPEPDVSTYQYDETSGYYYDDSTGLYYDASSQYYYNSTTGDFMYWDGEKKTYLPAPTEQQAQLEEAKKESNGVFGKETNKKDKVKVAKKIAKDMEKWAKTLNSQKDIQREAFKKMFQPIGVTLQNHKKEAATADAGFAILARSKKEDMKMMPPPPIPGGNKADKSPALVASYGENDSDNDDNTEEDSRTNGVLDETTLADYSKMACLLCKRQFPNQEALERHQQLSDLHKKNLEELRKSKGTTAVTPPSNQEMDSIEMTIQYRDRAKERRAKYGAPAPPVPKKTSQQSFSIPFEQTTNTKRALGADNKGSKLLQKMGWNEGQGLGKKGQGIVDPIQANKHTQGAGLGTLGASANIEDTDTYKEACKKVMLARFNDMD